MGWVFPGSSTGNKWMSVLNIHNTSHPAFESIMGFIIIMLDSVSSMRNDIMMTQ